jgi:hypothetical protein
MFQVPTFGLVIAARSLYVVEIADENISPMATERGLALPP